MHLINKIGDKPIFRDRRNSFYLPQRLWKDEWGEWGGAESESGRGGGGVEQLSVPMYY